MEKYLQGMCNGIMDGNDSIQNFFYQVREVSEI